MRLFNSLLVIHFLLDKATTSLVELQRRKVRPDANRGFFFLGGAVWCNPMGAGHEGTAHSRALRRGGRSMLRPYKGESEHRLRLS